MTRQWFFCQLWAHHFRLCLLVHILLLCCWLRHQIVKSKQVCQVNLLKHYFVKTEVDHWFLLKSNLSASLKCIKNTELWEFFIPNSALSSTLDVAVETEFDPWWLCITGPFYEILQHSLNIFFCVMYLPSQPILKCLFCHNVFMWCYMRSCYFSVVMCFNVCATNVIWPCAFLTTAQNHWKWSEWSEKHRTFCTLLSVFSVKFLLILKHYVLNSGT